MSAVKTPFKAGCKTTAMGIMPHTDIEQALKLALSVDIPFWPQLPHTSFYEDMYVQASEGFPGVIIDAENRKIIFDTSRFEVELGEYSRRMFEPSAFVLSPAYATVYRRFLKSDLHSCTAIRGQSIGPVSFGFRVTDENNRPVIYNDAVREILFDFIQKKVNVQYQQLREKNEHAFVWLDEPGLGWVFSGLSGYSDVQAKHDYISFLEGIEGLKALHLCANINLPYLLTMGTQLVSFDAYQMELMPKGYAGAVAGFIQSGGIISWGIVPTDPESLDRESAETLTGLLTGYWEVVSGETGLSVKQLAEQALVAPARCCLKNTGRVGACDDGAGSSHNAGTVEEQVVAKAFSCLRQVSEILKARFNL